MSLNNIYVALENLRSLQNIGAIFRTCSFFGIKNVILAGYSGKTWDLKGNVVLHEEIKKSSLGTEKDLSIVFLETSADLIDFAKKERLKLIAIEQEENSVLLKDWKPEKDTILVFGNEVDGVSRDILESAAQIVEIRRLGKHNSLNVTTTCGIVLYAICGEFNTNVIE